jgi:hypothetical protein
MRIEFISRLALLLVAGFLVIASQVWTGGTLEWLFIVGGVVMIALAAAGLASPKQPALDGLIALLGVWSVVEAIVFTGDTLEWVSFTTAVVGVALATIGLVIHEMTTERVVHELSVIPAEERLQSASRA